MSAPLPFPDRSLAGFHAGDSAILERCYREYFGDVVSAVGRVLRGADRDTVVHNVFFRVVSEASLRENFKGGNFAAWLSTVARNEAVDFRRKYARDAARTAANDADTSVDPRADEADAKMLVDRFVRERLPEKLGAVFEARFLRQLSQREAAEALGVARTTLVYQEQQIRDLLRSFLLEEA